MAKTASMLHDGYAAPARVGVLLPLHWQAVVAVLGAVTSGATAVLARTPSDLAGCELALVAPEHAEAALGAGVLDVLAVSSAPLGGRLTGLPPAVVDSGAEVLSYADTWTGPLARAAHVEVGGGPLDLADGALGVTAEDRVATSLPLGEPDGARVVLAALRAGAAVVLVADPRGADLAQEQVTSTAGFDLDGARRIA